MEQELALRLQEGPINFRTQVEVPVTTADSCFSSKPRPVLVFEDGPGSFREGSDDKRDARFHHLSFNHR